MSLPISEPILPDLEPESEPTPPPVRRRRSRHGLVPREVEQRAAFFRELLHQATPSAEFFPFAIVTGLIAGVALILDSPALFVLAAMLAPFMAPVLGLSVSAAIGNLGFFLRSLAAMAIGAVLVFVIGLLAGWVSLAFGGLSFSQSVFHTAFTWADLVVLLLGAALTAYLAARSTQQRPLVSSVALAYELYLPLAAAGFGLANPVPGLFPNGLLLFSCHLALAAVTAAFTLVLMGVRPLPSILAWLASILLMVVLIAGALAGIGSAVMPDWFGLPPEAVSAPPALTATPKPTVRVEPTTALPPTAVPSQTPQPPTVTATLTITPSATPTLVPTATATITLVPTATPVYGMVTAGDANGVIIRPEPASSLIVTTMLNGSLVEILPEVINKGGVNWIHVRTPDGKEGWVQQGLIATATPRPRN